MKYVLYLMLSALAFAGTAHASIVTPSLLPAFTASSSASAYVQLDYNATNIRYARGFSFSWPEAYYMSGIRLEACDMSQVRLAVYVSPSGSGSLNDRTQAYLLDTASSTASTPCTGSAYGQFVDYNFLSQYAIPANAKVYVIFMPSGNVPGGLPSDNVPVAYDPVGGFSPHWQFGENNTGVEAVEQCYGVPCGGYAWNTDNTSGAPFMPAFQVLGASDFVPSSSSLAQNINLASTSPFGYVYDIYRKLQNFSAYSTTTAVIAINLADFDGGLLASSSIPITILSVAKLQNVLGSRWNFIQNLLTAALWVGFGWYLWERRKHIV